MSLTTISTSLTAVITIGGWVLDLNVLGCKTPLRAILGLITLAIGSWIWLTIVLAFALKIPGAYGPVQYWVGDPEAYRFISGPRIVALFAILGGLLSSALLGLATAASVVRGPKGTRFKRIILPTFALANYGLAWWLFINCGFYPSA
ncbi:MAG: hypothetical protein AAGA75_07685 [Cyanobacteria bacterium P01_E01_bin.6]